MSLHTSTHLSSTGCICPFALLGGIVRINSQMSYLHDHLFFNVRKFFLHYLLVPMKIETVMPMSSNLLTSQWGAMTQPSSVNTAAFGGGTVTFVLQVSHHYVPSCPQPWTKKVKNSLLCLSCHGLREAPASNTIHWQTQYCSPSSLYLLT